MSNEESAMSCGLRWFLGRVGAALLFRVVVDRPTGVTVPRLQAVATPTLAGCPSGQRELTVNQPATPTVVRIHYLPRHRTAPDPRRRGAGAARARQADVGRDPRPDREHTA